jgi:hypothetical protein
MRRARGRDHVPMQQWLQLIGPGERGHCPPPVAPMEHHVTSLARQRGGPRGRARAARRRPRDAASRGQAAGQAADSGS